MFKILGDEDANTFLPWFVLKDLKETEKFYNERIANEYRKESAYFYAVCLKQKVMISDMLSERNFGTTGL